MWKNVVELQATDDNIIRRSRFTCWITRLQTHTHNI